MKHPDLLDGIAAEAPRFLSTPHIGGLVGVGFAGGGGTSLGLKRAGLKIDFAMNHDAAAIAMHAANCPEADHYLQDIWKIRPEKVRPGLPIRFMWFSPDCTHFSKAKGGAPLKKEIRDLAWVMLLWAKLRRPDVIAMENVEEFETWGPLDADGQPIKERQGEYFRAFLREWRRLGYVYGFRKIVACDQGDPTSRPRLFGQFRCDGHPITWPEPTHGAPHNPAVISGKLLPWVPAAAILDFSQPCYSIFMTREEARRDKIRINRPLVDATMARVTLGLQRFVLEAAEPFIVPITHGSAAPRARSANEPIWTQTATGSGKGGEHALAVPSLIPLTHQGPPRAHDTQEPSRTMTGANRGEIALAASYITKFRKDNTGADMREPSPTITANSYEKRPGGAAPIGVVEAYISTQYGNSVGHDMREPVGTQVQSVKHATAAVHMVQHNAGPNNDYLAGRPVGVPVSTLQTSGSQQNLAVSHLAHLRGAGDRPGNSVTDPTVVQTAGGTHVAEVRTFLVKYYQSAQHGQTTAEPLHSLTTKARFGLVEVSTADIPLTEEQRYTAYWVARLIDVYGYPDGKPKARRPKKGMGTLRYRTLIDSIEAIHRQRPSAVGRDGWLVWDIGMRMLTVRERFRAQGVGDDFIIDVEVDGKPITATKQGEMCGNMVCPGVAEAIARAALPELSTERARAAA